MPRRPHSYRFDTETETMISYIAAHHGVNHTAALKIAVRQCIREIAPNGRVPEPAKEAK